MSALEKNKLTIKINKGLGAPVAYLIDNIEYIETIALYKELNSEKEPYISIVISHKNGKVVVFDEESFNFNTVDTKMKTDALLKFMIVNFWDKTVLEANNNIEIDGNENYYFTSFTPELSFLPKSFSYFLSQIGVFKGKNELIKEFYPGECFVEMISKKLLEGEF